VSGLPKRIEERARSLATGAGTWSPPEAYPASTVLLMRDASAGIEVFMMRRSLTMAFAPGMYVFPGGRVDQRDFVIDPWPDAPWPDLAQRMSADEQLSRALVNCAIRELAEETGVELAHTAGLTALPIVDHWVTPEVEEHRYDVRFFACALPDGQQAINRGTEADVVEWLTPHAAIARFRAGDMPLLPPTVAALALIREMTDVPQALATLSQRPIQPLLPRAVVTDGNELSWCLVNDRTGDVIRKAHEMPHAWEARGVKE
jgi:8-oxo-dGTP pyrophosphatase MutT (NUDIX family)